MLELRPFHETIVDALAKLADYPLQEQDVILLFLRDELLPFTKIPANHDVIITAWKSALEKSRLRGDGGVVDSILTQKPKEMTHEEIVKDALSGR